MSNVLRRILLAEISTKVQESKVFSVWDSAHKTFNFTLSDADLLGTGTTSANPDGSTNGARATISKNAGVHYWETTVTFAGSANFNIGIQSESAVLSNPLGIQLPSGSNPLSFGIAKSGYSTTGGIKTVGAISSGTVIRHLLDLDTKSYMIANGAGAFVEFLSVDSLLFDYDFIPPRGISDIFPACRASGSGGNSSSVRANFGQSPFLYDVPEGANAGFYNIPISEVKLYLASEGFEAVIDGLSVHFDGRIVANQDVEIEREGSCWVWGNQSVSKRGKLVFVNNDNELDAWRDYNWRDASVLLKSGYEGQMYSQFVPWAFSRADTIELTRDARIILSLADPLAWLDRPFQPNLYPSDQENLQLAGKPIPVVYGNPLYCTAAKLSTVPSNRDYQLHDSNAVGLDLVGINQIYDSGDLFYGPDDVFVPDLAITAANGGYFSPQHPTFPVDNCPDYWTSVIGSSGDWTANSDHFWALSGALNCKGLHSPVLAIESDSVLRANTRYKIEFYCSSLPSNGTLFFRVPGTPDAAVSLTSPGTKTVYLDVQDAGKLQMVTKGDGINVYISLLTVSAEQVIDWNLIDGTKGFNLTNSPYGKIVANPQSTLTLFEDFLEDICNRVELPSIEIDGVSTLGYDYITAISLQNRNLHFNVDEYIDAPITGLALIRKLLDNWCGSAMSNRLGQVCFRRVTEPSNSVSLTLNKNNIIGEIVIVTDQAKDLTLRLSGLKNNTVHTDAEIATSVSSELSSFLQNEYGITVEGAPDSLEKVSSVYTSAIGAKAKGTSLRDKSALQAMANIIATLWRPNRNFYTMTVILDEDEADHLEPFRDSVRVEWPRWGLDAGENMLVVGVRSRFFSRKVDLKLWR